MQNLIKTEIEDQIDMNIKFFELISTKGSLRTHENRQFARSYSTLRHQSSRG